MRRFWNALAYYKDLRPGNLKSDRYKHLLLLLFWPAFGLVFMLLERALPLIARALMGRPIAYYEIVSPLDLHIPFCEWFVIPYYFWFVFLAWMLFYGLLFDREAFCGYMRFVILTYSATAIVYLLFPNMQSLRPDVLVGDGVLLEVVRRLYAFDTNTNVCPSIHVLGAFAVCFSGLRSKGLAHVGWRLFLILSTLLIVLSTVFLKQHSVIDVSAALLLSAVAYPFAYLLPRKRKGAET